MSSTPRIVISRLTSDASTTTDTPTNSPSTGNGDSDGQASTISSPTLAPLPLSPSKVPPLSLSPPLNDINLEDLNDIDTFKSSLTKAYSAASPTNNTDLWCPFFKQYLPPTLISHFRIITPNKYYSGAISYLFGGSVTDDADIHFNSLQNGMIMAKSIADLVVSGDFAIIPNQPDGENTLTHPIFGSKPENIPSPTPQNTEEATGTPLKLVLMKPHHSTQKVPHLNLPYSSVHNTPLVFKSSFRPDLRYCYFRYITTILIWLNLKEAMYFKNAWRPAQKWLRESLIVEMAGPERLSNPEVYAEIISGDGLFDDGGEDANVVVKMDNGWETTRAGQMAAQLEWGLLTAPDYKSSPHGHELRV
ncbi:hypothetical protein TWF481_009649 [Arthrobotrys musiformis]|uniref:HNH nuclease domain-containing protein n=1 Tax=Arthrobotrys musiformis TaxID=47236 RepID=A0AAV9WA44_9PEZI